MKDLFVFIRCYKKESILAPLFKLLEALFDLLVPLVMASVINVGIAGHDTVYIWKNCALLVVLAVIGFTCTVVAQYYAAKASVGFAADLRHELCRNIQSLGFSEIDTTGTSTLITRMTSDINQLQNGVNLFLRLFMRSPFVVFGAMILAFRINREIAWIFVIAIPVLAVIIFGVMLKTMPLYKKVQSKLDSVLGITRENLAGVRVVRAFNRQRAETERFEQANHELTSGQLFVGRISSLMNPLTYLVINLAIIAILNTGAVQINAGSLLAGDVIALISYMTQILVELVKLANLIIQVSRAMACGERIQTVLRMRPAMKFGTADPSFCASDSAEAVRFDRVSLKYAGAGGESLSDISFRAECGMTVGVIGGTGSGKTSLVSLIPRFYDATGGTVSVFGKPAAAWTKDGLRGSVGIVMQQTQLFMGTIRSNLLWGNEQASDSDLWDALETAQAADFVRQKPKGLDESVEQGGRNFSGGQKQRLTIARALVKKPRILILDDSSSALDFATDAALRKAIAALPDDITVFLVSQRTSSLRGADEILVMEDGRLVGCGKHEELLRTCEVYREIYESQFRKGETANENGKKNADPRG